MLWYVSSYPFHFAPRFSNESSISSMSYTNCQVQVNGYIYDKWERKHLLHFISLIHGHNETRHFRLKEKSVIVLY